MTVDNRKIAPRIATTIGVAEFYAEMLPTDKLSFVRAEMEARRKVIIINNSLVLSKADADVIITHSSAPWRQRISMFW